ncbi:NUDIX domain-containing protein [Micromonospora sp. HNM0581]|uniref:NUDIX hydrolase n=1 Tax=Micromonospora sp. HNM0581 TaxID=2716341 RepID=UPI00146EA3B7|nr:NUDIX domain-containing protein [Micromonospora sp. HNM0581]NLU77247.1 NUDIX domain-containing protein [Micromonospora sp. HNM0581]
MTTDSGFPAPPTFVEHARRFLASGAAPVVPRVAATVLLLRPADGGFEVYLIRRVVAMAFGGMYAFPGGGVDPSDSATPLDWAGPTPADWGVRLGLAPAAARAVVCAAAREVFEEAGVLLAGPDPTRVVGDVSDDGWEAARVDLEQRRVGFADLLAGRKLTLRSDLLLPWSRWVTPEFEPRRFDTYFFVALLPEGQRTRDVSGEADHTLWIRPDDARRLGAAGELTMVPPTLVTLGEVAAYADLAAVVEAAANRDAVTPIMPQLDLADANQPRFHLT